jgi:acyl-CoA synthetase (AMP-forming)/AMP-acid ligase II
MLLLGDILRRHARVRPNKTAYVTGEARVTYGDFHRRSNQLARALRGLGVGHGDRVAILANNVPEYPLVYFAVVKLGAIAVPLNARFKAEELAVLLEHSGAAVLFVSRELAPLLAPLRDTALAQIRHVVDIDSELGERAALESDDDVDAAIDEHDPHVMLYTSGTTGVPKGALLSHRSYCLQGFISHVTTGLGEDDIGLCMFPMFHMGGWAMPLGFWNSGSTVVIMPKAEPRAMLDTIGRERVTYFYAVPTVFNALLALPDFDRFDLGSLRAIASGTAAMTREQVFAIIERFRCPQMFIIYGSTEAGPVAVLRPADVQRRPESVGRPFVTVEVRLLDAEGREVPADTVGEIAVRSEYTMRGYWRMPDETAAAITDGWVRTGDLGVFDDEGFLSIVGRLKEVIRSAGENIFPAEVERVLLQHPDIADAAAVGVPDPHWGEALAVAVVVRPGAALSAGDVIDHVSAHLATFKKPRRVLFLAELPRTAASRQVQKPLLREMILARPGN